MPTGKADQRGDHHCHRLGRDQQRTVDGVTGQQQRDAGRGDVDGGKRRKHAAVDQHRHQFRRRLQGQGADHRQIGAVLRQEENHVEHDQRAAGEHQRRRHQHLQQVDRIL